MYLLLLLFILLLIVLLTISCRPEPFSSTQSQHQMIWFHHVHKAGGTSLIKLAEANGEKLYYKDSRNGNPANRYGYFIPFAKLSTKEQGEFIEDARENGTTFIATEFDFPKPGAKYNDPGIINVIMVRDPVDKLISHLSHILREPESTRLDFHHRDPETLVKENTPHFGNEMTKVLAGHGFNYSGQLTQNDYQIALKNLKNFDIILVLEDPNSLYKMQKVGWRKMKLPKENISSTRDFQTNSVDTKKLTLKILKDWLGPNYREVLRKQYAGLDQKLYNYAANQSNKNYK